MNILHAISKQQEVSPKLKKLQASCKEDGESMVQLEKEELKKRLSPMQYRVTQEKGTEGYAVLLYMHTHTLTHTRLHQ